MLSPKGAFVIGMFSKPNEHGFSGVCKDYHGCYFYPYAQKPGEVGSAFLIVDKKTGAVYPFDPIFDALEFCNKPDAWSFDPDAIRVAAEKSSKYIARL